ncbi:MAG: PKD domain-containing protein [Planctomycetota bacterium]
MQLSTPVLGLAIAMIPSVAMAQTVTEIPAPTVPTVLADLDLLTPGPTTVAAINAVAPGSSIGAITLTPNTAVAGVFNTFATEQGLGLVGGGLAILDTSGTAAFDAFDAQVDLIRSCTEIGFGFGDWGGTAVVEFYSAGTLVTTITTSAFTSMAPKYFQMVGGTFDRIDVSTTAGNWVFGDFVVEPGNGLFASFAATPSSGSSPLVVAFTDTSFTNDPGGVLSWAWDFDGDGTIDSTNATDTFTYTSCGSYDVTLTVTDALNGSSTTTAVGAVLVDPVTASFNVTNIGPGIWQFDDTSSPNPSAWAWDFDGDGTIDDTNQIGIYVDPTQSSILGLPNCTLTVTGAGGCLTDTLVRPVAEVAGATRVEGEVNGGNGTIGTPAVGTYFDIEVLNAEGLNLLALDAAIYNFTGTVDVNIYITSGTHVGKEGQPDEWTLAGSGTGAATGTGVLAAPELLLVPLNAPFYLPPGSYGVALYHVNPLGGAINISYTNGPGFAPYGNADMTIHPNGVGCSSTTELGPCSFTPRLWNGAFYYGLCSTTGMAAAGSYASGCANSSGTVPSLSVASLPQLGASYTLDVETGLAAPAAVLLAAGVNKDLYNGLPLPLDLGIIGAAGCELATSVDATDVLVAGPGATPWSLPIPANPALACFTFYFQGAVLDLPANSLGFVLTNAVAGVVGS